MCTCGDHETMQQLDNMRALAAEKPEDNRKLFFNWSKETLLLAERLRVKTTQLKVSNTTEVCWQLWHATRMCAGWRCLSLTRR